MGTGFFVLLFAHGNWVLRFFTESTRFDTVSSIPMANFLFFIKLEDVPNPIPTSYEQKISQSGPEDFNNQLRFQCLTNSAAENNTRLTVLDTVSIPVKQMVPYLSCLPISNYHADELVSVCQRWINRQFLLFLKIKLPVKIKDNSMSLCNQGPRFYCMSWMLSRRATRPWVWTIHLAPFQRLSNLVECRLWCNVHDTKYGLFPKRFISWHFHSIAPLPSSLCIKFQNGFTPMA